MQNLIEDIRRRLFATPDTVCLERAWLVTESFRKSAGQPMCLRRAQAFANVVEKMTIDVLSNPVFAGNTSSRMHAWMLVPEHGIGVAPQVLLENEGLEHLFDDAVPGEILSYWQENCLGGLSDPGHLAVDLDKVVGEGLASILAEIDAVKETGTQQQRDYRQAMAISIQAVIRYATRCAEHAVAAADTVEDPLVKRCLLRVARACRQVPAYPARDLFEGLQAIALIQLLLTVEGHGMSVSIGLPDRVLARFATKDLPLGETSELIAAFLLKIAANSVFGRGSKTQAITIGGCDHRGRDCANILTRCFLEGANLARVGDPHVFLRWHDHLDPCLKRRSGELLSAGLSMPLLINDGPTAAGFVRAGVRVEDAFKYCVIGCNELGIPALACDTANAAAGNIQFLELLNEFLLNHKDPDSVRGTGEILAGIKRLLGARLARGRQTYIDRRAKWVGEQAPMPLTSALFRNCISAGKDYTQAAEYRIPALFERGLSNAADALAAIEKLVYHEHSLSLGELVAEMRGDFPRENLLSQIRSAPKWGNGDERADFFALALLSLREDVLASIDAEFGHDSHTVCHVVRSLHHLDGKRILASPDGRHAFAPVADSVGAEGGVAKNGPTALLKSVAKIDAATFYKGGYNLNLTLPCAGSSSAMIEALVEGFFREGGQELQVNCLDPDVLCEAQRRPEGHGDLIVRFAGLSARFIDLSRVEQDELIRRAGRATAD